MKVLSKVLMVGSLLGGMFLVACGNNNSNNITCPAGEINQNNVCVVSGTAGISGTCGVAGQIQTAQGCGQECSYGSSIGGLVGNQCLPAVAGTGYGVGGYPGSPYGNPYTTGQCASIPGTYPVQGPGGQILCQPGYSGGGYGYGGGGYGYGGGGYGGGYGYYIP